MAIRRQYMKGGEIIVEFTDAPEFRLSPLETAAVRDTATLRQAAERKLGRPLSRLHENQIHLHRNRDGTFELIGGNPIAVPYEDQEDTIT